MRSKISFNSNFNYDATDRLIGADYNYQTDENYTYDDNGNRTNTGYVTGINNRLLEDGKYRYEYDPVGNRTKRTNKSTNEVTEYTWDVRDRLIGFKLKNASGTVIKSATYIYDVYDQRIAKIVDPDGVGALPAVTERFVYGTNQNIALVFDGNGTLTHRYLFGDGIDQIEADEQVATGTTLWALTDHLGNVRDVVDNSGTVQNHIVYDAFGNIISQSNSSVNFRNTYTGQEFDSESGLFNYGGRYYDPFTGKFIQEDKIGFGGGDTNLSRYVENSPIVFIDPKGESKVIPLTTGWLEALKAARVLPGRTDLFLDHYFNGPRTITEDRRVRFDLTERGLINSVLKSGGVAVANEIAKINIRRTASRMAKENIDYYSTFRLPFKQRPYLLSDFTSIIYSLGTSTIEFDFTIRLNSNKCNNKYTYTSDLEFEINDKFEDPIGLFRRGAEESEKEEFAGGLPYDIKAYWHYNISGSNNNFKISKPIPSISTSDQYDREYRNEGHS